MQELQEQIDKIRKDIDCLKRSVDAIFRYIKLEERLKKEELARRKSLPNLYPVSKLTDEEADAEVKRLKEEVAQLEAQLEAANSADS